MPWLTPENDPTGFVRRVILLPDDTEWVAAFYGALFELSLAENWEAAGNVLPENAAAVWEYVFGELLDGEECPDPDP